MPRRRRRRGSGLKSYVSLVRNVFGKIVSSTILSGSMGKIYDQFSCVANKPQCGISSSMISHYKRRNVICRQSLVLSRVVFIFTKLILQISNAFFSLSAFLYGKYLMDILVLADTKHIIVHKIKLIMLIQIIGHYCGYYQPLILCGSADVCSQVIPLLPYLHVEIGISQVVAGKT